MEKVGLFEAKTHLSELVDRASRGETFAITKHGRLVAKLVPAEESVRRMTSQEAAAKIREIQSRSTLGQDLTLRQLIDEGRRF